MIAREADLVLDKSGKYSNTLAAAMGRHDCLIFYILLQAFVHIFSLIDMITVSIYRGLPLLLLPWSLQEIYRFKLFHLKTRAKSTFKQFIVLSIVMTVAIILPKYYPAHQLLNTFTGQEKGDGGFGGGGGGGCPFGFTS